MTTKVSPALQTFNDNGNYYINGNFDIWQRGITSSLTGYLSDRWKDGGSGVTKTSSRETFSLGQTDVPNNPKYYHRTIITVAGVAAGDNTNFHQRVEGVKVLADETITASFWVKADSSKNMAVDFTQYFGTGGSPSTTNHGIGVTTLNLTTSWQKITITVSVPSISGKTLGTDGNDYFRMMLWYDAGSTYDARTNSLGHQTGTFDVAQFKIEKGSIATSFENRPIAEELALCQRFFEKSYGIETPVGTITLDGILYFRQDRIGTSNTLTRQTNGQTNFKTTKRAIPTMTGYNPDTGTAGEVRTTADDNFTIDGFVGVGQNGFPSIDTSAAADANKTFQLHWTADAEL